MHMFFNHLPVFIAFFCLTWVIALFLSLLVWKGNGRNAVSMTARLAVSFKDTLKQFLWPTNGSEAQHVDTGCRPGSYSRRE